MKKSYVRLLASVLTLVTISLSSCGDDNGITDSGSQPGSYTVCGKVEKGPFISGSTINMQPMDARMMPNGSTFSTTITDHSGAFSFAAASLDAPYAQLTANGYFFNEVTGALSKGTLTLRALADLSQQSTVNVNLLTHLKYARILDLVEKDRKTYADANRQAQRELLTAFGLQRLADTDAASYSITSGTPEAGALIAISSMILCNRSEAQTTEYLARLCREFGQDGTFSVDTKTQMQQDRMTLLSKLRDIADNIRRRYADLGQSVSVVPLEYYFDWNGDGIAGNEMSDPNDPPTLSQTQIAVPCQGGHYTVRITSKVPLYLESRGLGDPSGSVIGDQELSIALYSSESRPGAVSWTLTDGTLDIVVGQTGSKKEAVTEIPLYDFVGNVVAHVTLSQAGDPSLPAPKLGVAGEALVLGAFQQLAAAMTSMAVDVNGYSALPPLVIMQAPLDKYDTRVHSLWTNFYSAINRILMLDYYDRQEESAFTALTDVFLATAYYNMVVLWGDVPFVKEYNAMPTTDIVRYPAQPLLDELQSRLEVAMTSLEEKKNVCTNDDVNSLFAVSRDVARILLSNIYMYQHQWAKALPLLRQVERSGYYTDQDIIMSYFNKIKTRAVITVSTDTIPSMSYSDLLLSLAECEYQTGNESVAWQYARRVASSLETFGQGDAIPERLLEYIAHIRRYSLYGEVGAFAYLKRVGLAGSLLGLADYQHLFPIPGQEQMLTSSLTQNPGY